MTLNSALKTLSIALLLLALLGCAKKTAVAPVISDEALLAGMMKDITGGIEKLSDDVMEAADTAGEDGLAGDRTREALAKLCEAHRDYLIDCSAIDSEGIMVAIEPAEYRRFEGSNVSRHAVSRSVEETKEPSISQAFMTAEKIRAVALEWPVFSREGKWMGAVSALLSPGRFLGPLVEKSTRPAVYSGWVTETDGDLLYSPFPKLIGHNFFTDPYLRHLKELMRLGRRVISEPSGTGVFRSPRTGQGDFAERRCMWDTVDLHNARWRVILVKKI